MIGKIAFLFLAISQIYHEDIWIDFFKGHEDHYSIYIHAKENFDPSSAFKKYEISKKIPTTWSKTIEAQVELLKEALKNPDNKKFIFLSESTVPLQSFDSIYEQAMSNTQSMFGYSLNASRKYPPIPDEIMHKNSQWIILNREHAQLMVDDTYYRLFFTYCDQEHYPSTLLALHKKIEQVIKKDSTLVLWVQGEGSHPHAFSNLHTDPHFEEIKRAINRSSHMFARKFSKECDLTLLRSLLPWLDKKA